jgi:signal transduction histidine kinase
LRQAGAAGVGGSDYAFGGMPRGARAAYPWVVSRTSPWPAARRFGVIAGVLVTGAALVQFGQSEASELDGITHGPDALGVALTLLTTLPLAFVHWFPRTATVATLTGFVLLYFLGYLIAFGALSTLFILTLAAAQTPRPDALVIALTGGLVVALAIIFGPGGTTIAGLIGNIALFTIAPLFGDGIREQREAAARLAARAAELETLRDVATREAVASERLRIAREVHDVVGHALAAITLHARVAQRQLKRHPETASQSLDDIAELASTALGETRGAVGSIRAGEPAELEPQPGLSDLDALVERLRSPDLDIELYRHGSGPAPPAAVQAAAFRIVQESLSNALNHARPARVTVSIDRRPGQLVLDVLDRSPTHPRRPGPVRNGSGLLGMRERAASVGGEVAAGPAPDGGWHVTATLPDAR